MPTRDLTVTECQNPDDLKVIRCVQRIRSQAARARRLVEGRAPLSEFVHGELRAWATLAQRELQSLASAIDAVSATPKVMRRRLNHLTEPNPPIGSGWGPWRLNTATLTIELHHQQRDYGVDLDRCRSAAEVLDWIAQVAQKTWASDAILAGLVRAVDDILHPQAHLCPSGQPGSVSGYIR